MKTLSKVECILQKIRLSRMKKGYSQEYVGEMLNLSQYAYHKIENGKTKLNLKYFIMLCIILEVDAAEMLKRLINFFPLAIIDWRDFFDNC